MNVKQTDGVAKWFLGDKEIPEFLKRKDREQQEEREGKGGGKQAPTQAPNNNKQN